MRFASAELLCARACARPGGRSGILLFNAESEAELEILMEESARLAGRSGKPPAAAIRVNPRCASRRSSAHCNRGVTSTSLVWNGPKRKRLYLAHRDSEMDSLQGISAHIGSQITTLVPFRRALGRLLGLSESCARAQIDLRIWMWEADSVCAIYDQKPPTRTEYARLVSRMVRKLGVHLLLEPGRSIIAPAGVLLTRVVYLKANRRQDVCGGGFGDERLDAAGAYGAIHPITKVVREAKKTIPNANVSTSSAGL